MIRIIILISMFFLKVFAKEAHSSFLNPLTDICWKCLFPIHISGVNVTPAQKDWATYSLHPLCSCSGFPPKVGIPLAFWEPTGLVDVTRIPYQLKAWGGIQISEPGIKKRGTVSNNGDSGRTSFYNVHYYHFPVLHWANVLTSFSCLDKSEVSISYMSELDPFWDDDQWASVLNPEIYLFANPLAQSACIGDCTLSSMDKPNDKLFWCAGCSGTLYPFVGYVPHHVGAVQASYLLVQRLLAKLHQLGMRKGFEENEFCEAKTLPRLKKTLYKTQLVQPIPNTKGPCQPLGKSDIVWGSGTNFAKGGEDFVYLIWTKKHCCLDAVDPSLKYFSGDVIP